MLACEIATVARAALAQQARVQLEADQEHVEDDADLGEDAEERRRRRGGSTYADALRAEQRRPEQDAGDDLADDRRLPDAREQPRQQLAGDDHGRERDENLGQHGRQIVAAYNPVP